MPYYLRNRKEPIKFETVYSLKEIIEGLSSGMIQSKTEFTKKQNQSVSELIASSFWIPVSLLKNKVKDPKDLNQISSYSAEELWKWFGSPHSKPITQHQHIQSTVSHIPNQNSLTRLEALQYHITSSEKTTNYFVKDAAKKEYGPIGFEKICSWISERRLNHFSNCRIEMVSTWKTLSEFPEFADHLNTIKSNQNIKNPLKPTTDSISDFNPFPKHESNSPLDLSDKKNVHQNANDLDSIRSDWTSVKKYSFGLLIFLYIILIPSIIGVFKELLNQKNEVSIFVVVTGVVISAAPLGLYKIIGFACACPKCRQRFARITDSKQQAYSKDDYTQTKGWATVLRKDSIRDNNGKKIATIEREEKAYGTWVKSSEYWKCHFCGHFWKTNKSYFRE